MTHRFFRIKRSRLIPVAATAIVTAGLLTFSSAPNTASADSHDPFTNGDELTVFVNPFSGDSIQGGHFDGWLNEYPAGDDYSQIGGIGLLRFPDGCSEYSCTEWHVGYCSEADQPIQIMTYQPYVETSIDSRLSYLTWRYSYDF